MATLESGDHYTKKDKMTIDQIEGSKYFKQKNNPATYFFMFCAL